MTATDKGTEHDLTRGMVIRELEMWVSHVRGEGKDGDGEVSKMITQRLRTLSQGDTIGDVDLTLRRTHLASVIVSSDTCELVHTSIYVYLRHHYCTPSTNARDTE